MKKVITIASIAIAAFSAQAEYLWWGVNEQNNDSLAAVSSWVAGEGGEWTRANLYYIDGDGRHELDYTTPASQSSPLVSYSSQTQTDLSTLGDFTTFSYYVEIVNSSSQVIGYTATPVAYSDIQGSITTTLETVPSVTVWHGGSYKAAPEPTSAMLMLLGVAGLALRRKQRKA